MRSDDDIFVLSSIEGSNDNDDNDDDDDCDNGSIYDESYHNDNGFDGNV